MSSAKKAENKAFTANPMAISVFVRRSTKAITCAAAFIHDTIHVYVRIVCVCVALLSPVFRSYSVQASVVDDGEKVEESGPV